MKARTTFKRQKPLNPRNGKVCFHYVLMLRKLRIRKSPTRENQMSISGIGNALNIASLVSGVLRSGGNDAASPETTDGAATSRSAIAEIGKLLPPGGLRAIEPEQFAEFARELHERGAISESEFNDLAAIRLELELSGAASDQPIDIIGFLKERIGRLEAQYDVPESATQFSLGQALDTARRRLDFVQQLDATARQGVNAVA